MNSQIDKKLRKLGYEFVGLDDSTSKNSCLDKPFLTWFWENVLGNSSKEYRREFYREMHFGHTIGPSPRSFGSPDIRSSSLPYSGILENDLAFRLIFLMIPGSFFWVLHHAIRVTLRKLRRPSYYERECERRIQLGITRRSIRMRKTVNKQPTIDDIRTAWNGARHSPEGALRLGGMLEDLECYVNNLTIGNEINGYRGRHGGIKRHLQANAPDLFEHYAALMRYKSIARKFRQACEISDPNPADALLPLSSPPRPQKVRTNWSEQIKQSVGRPGDLVVAERDWKPDEVQKGVKSWVLDGFMFAWREDCWIKRASYETAIRVLRACENSVISLEAALALEIDPNFVTKESVERFGIKIKATTKRLKQIGTGKLGKRIGPNESSEIGPNESSEVSGVDKISLAGGVSARVTAWLKRRTCA